MRTSRAMRLKAASTSLVELVSSTSTETLTLLPSRGSTVDFMRAHRLYRGRAASPHPMVAGSDGATARRCRSAPRRRTSGSTGWTSAAVHGRRPERGTVRACRRSPDRSSRPPPARCGRRAEGRGAPTVRARPAMRTAGLPGSLGSARAARRGRGRRRRRSPLGARRAVDRARRRRLLRRLRVGVASGCVAAAGAAGGLRLLRRRVVAGRRTSTSALNLVLAAVLAGLAVAWPTDGLPSSRRRRAGGRIPFLGFTARAAIVVAARPRSPCARRCSTRSHRRDTARPERVVTASCVAVEARRARAARRCSSSVCCAATPRSSAACTTSAPGMDPDAAPAARPAGHRPRARGFQVFPQVPSPPDREGFTAGRRPQRRRPRRRRRHRAGHRRRSTTPLAFLSGTCLTCQRFWDAFRKPDEARPAPPTSGSSIVTKGAGEESPARIAELAPPGIPLVMSTRGVGRLRRPRLALLRAGRRAVGPGPGRGHRHRLAPGARLLDQVAGRRRARRASSRPGGSPSRPADDDRERRVDDELHAAGHPARRPQPLRRGPRRRGEADHRTGSRARAT